MACSRHPTGSKLVYCKMRCHPDRSEAKWRDLLFILRSIESEWKRYPALCHPDRSEAKWRDLQFSRPPVEMFSALFPPPPGALFGILDHNPQPR
jgi:hypothetical protein